MKKGVVLFVKANLAVGFILGCIKLIQYLILHPGEHTTISAIQTAILYILAVMGYGYIINLVAPYLDEKGSSKNE